MLLRKVKIIIILVPQIEYKAECLFCYKCAPSHSNIRALVHTHTHTQPFSISYKINESMKIMMIHMMVSVSVYSYCYVVYSHLLAGVTRCAFAYRIHNCSLCFIYTKERKTNIIRRNRCK